MAEIRLEGVTKAFDKVTAVDDVSLEIADGEFMVLLGPSGCGKTTLLRVLAGLEYPEGGRVRIGENDVTDLPPRKREIAMVFQSYAVFPHLKVFDNIAFGLRMRGIERQRIRERTERAAGMVELSDFLDRYPAQLSGGQRQRVAVARAIVMVPAVLLTAGDGEVLVGIRAENIQAATEPFQDAVRASTQVVEPLGSHLLVTAAIGEQGLKVVTPADFPAHPNRDLWLRFDAAKLRLFPAGRPEDAVAAAS